MSTLKIATRRSQLAQRQTDLIIERLLAHADVQAEKVLISTRGDRILNVALDKIGGKGLFVKDIETALLEGRADAAVHSMKDVPYWIADAFEIAAVLARHDVRDALVSAAGHTLRQLPAGARIGTGSRRRALQLNHLRPDLEIVPLRGNVQTRLKKLHTEGLDGVILAAAGLQRLGLQDVITDYLDPQQVVPAVGQGALGVEIVRDCPQAARFKALDDADTRLCVEAERSFLERLEADCHAAVGAYAVLAGDQIQIIGIFEVAGRLVRRELSGPKAEYRQLGRQLAEMILAA